MGSATTTDHDADLHVFFRTGVGYSIAASALPGICSLRLAHLDVIFDGIGERGKQYVK